VLQRRKLDRVQLIAGDVNELQPGALRPPGPFDAAYCRLLLVNQEEPSLTLRRIASLVRPGGHVIAHELLDDPGYPVFDPPVPAFERLLHWMREAMRRKDKRPDAARHLHSLASEAGLKTVSQQGFFGANPQDAAGFIQSDGLGILLAMEAAFRHYGLATPAEINELANELQAAARGSYRAFFSWIFVELIAQVP
jgi:hypothetical protein